MLMTAPVMTLLAMRVLAMRAALIGAVGVTAGLAGTAAHHLEHRAAAGAEEAHQQCRSEQQENDVEIGRVVPLQAGLADLRVPGGRDQAERAERELDDVACDDHGGIED